MNIYKNRLHTFIGIAKNLDIMNHEDWGKHWNNQYDKLTHEDKKKFWNIYEDIENPDRIFTRLKWIK